MSEPQKSSSPSPTPNDTPVARKVPARGTRKRVLGEGEGDFVIHEVMGVDSGMPKGALVPIPTVPRFESTAAAVKWIRNESGDLLAGKQVMIFKACEILSLQITQKPTVVIQSKPKITVSRPETSDG